MSPGRAFAIVTSLALAIIGGYTAFLEAKKHWTGLQSLLDVVRELAKSNPINLLLLFLGIVALAAATSDRWLNRHLRFEWSQTNPAVHPQSWETGEWVVYVRNHSPTKTVYGVRVVLESYRRAEWHHYMPVHQQLERATGRPIWRQMTWQLSAWSHSVLKTQRGLYLRRPAQLLECIGCREEITSSRSRRSGKEAPPPSNSTFLPFMKKRVCRWRPPLGGISWAPKTDFDLGVQWPRSEMSSHDGSLV